jgi:transcriptional regulator with XRE-family HTH domain
MKIIYSKESKTHLKRRIPLDFPSRIRKLRSALGLTQTRLAELMGVSFASVNRWENGQSRPSALAWQQIDRAEKLGIEALSKDYLTVEHASVATQRRTEEPVHLSESSINIDFSTNSEVVRAVAEGERLGWEEVRSQLKDQEIDPIRSETLSASLEDARRKIPEAIQQAYCIVVTVSEKNEVQAFKVTVGGGPLFATLKAESRTRIRETAISADALLPGGPYDLWREGETSRRVKDLVGAFAQFPHLPKMLNRGAILDTLVGGCREGLFVLRLTRPDRSLRTWWRDMPDENALKDPALEVVLPEEATLSELSPPLLAPGVLPGLWETLEITLADLGAYFSGDCVVKSQKEGYEEPMTIPQAERAVVEEAVHSAVRDGKLWLTSGPASILAEEIPAGLLTDDARLQAPPQPIPTTDILPEILPEAWSGETTTALALSVALSKRAGKTLPWVTVREVLNGAFRARLLERTSDSGGWPCDFAGAGNVKLRVPSEEPPPQVAERLVAKPGVLVAEADLRPNEIQDLADQVADIAKAAVGLDLKFRLRVELGGESRPSDEVVASINQLLREISNDIKLR